MTDRSVIAIGCRLRAQGWKMLKSLTRRNGDVFVWWSARAQILIVYTLCNNNAGTSGNPYCLYCFKYNHICSAMMFSYLPFLTLSENEYLPSDRWQRIDTDIYFKFKLKFGIVIGWTDDCQWHKCQFPVVQQNCKQIFLN